MCNCSNSIPTIGVEYVEVKNNVATLYLSGAVPCSGRFNVRVCGCCLNTCSATPIAMIDCVKTKIVDIIDRCGNPVFLGKVAVQARKHALLHFCRSASTDTVVLQDTICCPTPITTVVSSTDVPVDPEVTPVVSASTTKKG